MKNMLLAMSGGDKVHFHTFLNGVHWINHATTDEKIKAIFLYFNNGTHKTIVLR